MDMLTQIAWSALPALLSGIVLAIFGRQQNKRDQAADKLNLLAATADLSCATAVSLKYGRTNGEIDEGLKQYNKAIAAFRDYEREKLAEQV